MAEIEYIAKRSLAGGHLENSLVVIELDVESAQPRVEDIKEIARSPGGSMETSYERTDVLWTIQFAPVFGNELDLLRELLDSTESGELFRVWLWPEDSPLYLKRIEDGHSEETFIRRGGERSDCFRGQLTALQTAPYDPSGSGQESGGVPSGAGGGGGTTDVYTPDAGGGSGGADGGLDPDPAPGIGGPGASQWAWLDFSGGLSAVVVGGPYDIIFAGGYDGTFALVAADFNGTYRGYQRESPALGSLTPQSGIASVVGTLKVANTSVILDLDVLLDQDAFTTLQVGTVVLNSEDADYSSSGP